MKMCYFVHLLNIQLFTALYTIIHPRFIHIPLQNQTKRRIFVFSHAPPNGSGIRIIQENHVVNGCCWLNHSDEKNCRKFIEIVREHRCIKGWFSGHFHLGQDYQGKKEI